MTLELISEAERAGARREVACDALGLSVRTVERWSGGACEDLRRGPITEPGNKLTSHERQAVMAAINSPRYRDFSPNQIVPLLADEDRYLASESTMYRLLREASQLRHRERSRLPVRRPPNEHVATGPNQVWSWDITYLRSPILGAFFYLYLVVDIWSRRIMAWEVCDTESDELSSQLIERTCLQLGIDPTGLVLHSDNGGPMKGSTMVATLERLGILPSLSRPRVSDDNPFSEALFRTLKYCPEYPTGPFTDIAAARSWVGAFVAWYNEAHLHSGIRFVTPDDRHFGLEQSRLAARSNVYQSAKNAHPERWSGATRCWEPIGTVYLNPKDAPTASSHITPTSPGGRGALAPSGAGRSPDRAQQGNAEAQIDPASPAPKPHNRTVAPIGAPRAQATERLPTRRAARTAT